MMNFDSLVPYGSLEAAKLWQSTSGQIQHGGRPPNSTYWNCNNSAADSSISLTFGVYLRYGFAENWSPPTLKSKMCIGPEFSTFKSLNNSAADWSISLKICMWVQNRCAEGAQWVKSTYRRNRYNSAQSDFAKIGYRVWSRSRHSRYTINV